MKTKVCLFSVWLLLLSQPALATETASDWGLGRAVPVEAHLAICAKHNPERDYQRKYLEEIWQTAQDEKLVERFMEIFTSRIPENDLAEAESVFETIRTAIEPIDCKALLDCREFVYAQQMVMPINQHLVLLRLTTKDAEGMERGFQNLLMLLEEKSDGKVQMRVVQQAGATVTKLALPPKVPFQLVLIRFDDVVLFSTNEQLAQSSLALLQGNGGESLLDDLRLAEALAKLPEPEDCLMFFDGQKMFKQLGGIGQFIRQKSGGDEEAVRMSKLIELLIDELSVLDYTVAVEYTEDQQNCSAEFEKLLPGSDEKLLGMAMSGGQPFEKWQSWVPADAVSYSLSTGVNLHPIYARLMEIVQEKFPEAQEGLDRFEAIQEQIGVQLDRDLLQSFSGESVSITLPAESTAMMGGQDSVTALRCQNPDRIQELLHRLVDVLTQHPAIEAQQLKLSACDELDGFEELGCTFFGMFGLRPVIGFQEGWMIVGSNPAAVQKVLDARAGNTTNIEETDGFRQFKMQIAGPVQSLRAAR